MNCLHFIEAYRIGDSNNVESIECKINELASGLWRTESDNQLENSEES